jgi:hypothetical protein
MKKTLRLVAYDLKFVAGEFQPLRFIIIAVVVIIFMWSYPVRLHPLFYIFVLGLASLEGAYMNAFFRLPNELERMILFPVSWQTTMYRTQRLVYRPFRFSGMAYSC